MLVDGDKAADKRKDHARGLLIIVLRRLIRPLSLVTTFAGHVDAVDEADDEHGVEDRVDEEEPEVSDRVVPSNALAEEVGMLMVIVDAAVALFAVEHVRRLDDETLIAVQVCLVRIIGQLLELSLLNLVENGRDQMVWHLEIHHDVQLEGLRVVAPEADPGEAQHAQEEHESEDDRKFCQAVHRPDHEE